MAYVKGFVLITNDKDFGEQTYRDRKSHRGIILLRLENERASNKIAVLQRLLENYSGKLQDNFVVVTEKRVRIAGK